MARMITTVSIRPELIPKYNMILAETGNFSGWVCNRIEAAFNGDEALLMQIDGLKKQALLIRKELSLLYKGHGIIRKEIQNNPNITKIYDMMLEEFENAQR